MSQESKDGFELFIEFLDTMREDINKLQEEVELLKKDKTSAKDFAKNIINDIKLNSRL